MSLSLCYFSFLFFTQSFSLPLFYFTSVEKWKFSEEKLTLSSAPQPPQILGMAGIWFPCHADQEDTGHQMTLALGASMGFALPQSVQCTSLSSLGSCLLYTACMAADIHFHSCLKEFLFCCHVLDLMENSSLTRSKNCPTIQAEVSPSALGEVRPSNSMTCSLPQALVAQPSALCFSCCWSYNFMVIHLLSAWWDGKLRLNRCGFGFQNSNF